MDRVDIQLQDQSGNWRTYHVTMNQPQLIISSMRELKARYPNYRVRAVDQNGRLVDLL